MLNGLIVSHRGTRCGVYQFSRGLHEMLSKSDRIFWAYEECAGPDELTEILDTTKPDIIIFNHHPSTMPWLHAAPLRSTKATLFCLMHGVTQEIADSADPYPFDFLICLDPTLTPRNPRILSVPRFAPHIIDHDLPLPETFTIGSFGFATPGKGFDRLCALVCQQFDQAIIRLNIPMHDNLLVVSEASWQGVVDACGKAITKPGVELKITSEFFDQPGLMKFLASNTINVFCYDDAPMNGVSSCADFALASGRPFALTRSSMFRNLFDVNPSIFVEDRTIADIAVGGASMLEGPRAALAPEAACAAWTDALFAALASMAAIFETPDGRGYNKILDERSRNAYGKALGLLKQYAPDMIQRKIERANIQQAFGLDCALRFLEKNPNARIVAAGSYEDTAVMTLRAMGYRIDEVDPNVNGLTLQDFYCSQQAQLGSYDLALSISVLEHVEDDAQFVRIISELLRPGGLAVLTVDFAEKWLPGLDKPVVDHRLYTTKDICERLMPAIGDCTLVDWPTWREGAEDFEYEGSHYGFAGFVFRKLPPEAVKFAPKNPVWRDMLAECNEHEKKPIQSGDKMTALRRFFSVKN